MVSLWANSEGPETGLGAFSSSAARVVTAASCVLTTWMCLQSVSGLGPRVHPAPVLSKPALGCKALSTKFTSLLEFDVRCCPFRPTFGRVSDDTGHVFARGAALFAEEEDLPRTVNLCEVRHCRLSDFKVVLHKEQDPGVQGERRPIHTMVFSRAFAPRLIGEAPLLSGMSRTLSFFCGLRGDSLLLGLNSIRLHGVPPP
ncbi:hypothetical protein WMY93_034180 [Mugilogobius chulae]|uniref:Uncharacterized protein n=1 Tax=Mugilogobius chulae TaxID=88201 RepID=A0AAW0MPE2_9GOBI